MPQKMTLQQYIESRNYKRRLLSRSKSKNKLQQLQQNPLVGSVIDPSVLTGSSDSKDQHKIVFTAQMSDLVSQIKEIDEEAQGFSLIHKKVQAIKEFAIEYIRDDKIFVSFCKRLDELESIYRLELIEAYRFQLFKYQFDNEGKLDQQKKRMIKMLNDLYMNSKFEYKKSINKQKTELTKSQKQVLQNLIQLKAKQGAKTKEQTENQKQKLIGTSSGLIESQYITNESQCITNEPVLNKQPTSILQSITMMLGSKDKQSPQIKNSNIIEPKFLSKASYRSGKSDEKQGFASQKIGSNYQKPTQSNSPAPESNPFKQKTTILQNVARPPKISNPPYQQRLKDSLQIKTNNANLMRSPSAKKVAFLLYDSRQQNPQDHPIPDFQSKRQKIRQNPEQVMKEIDQSDVNLGQNTPSSSSGSQIVGSFLSLLNKNSSKQDKIKTIQKPVRTQRQQKAQKPPVNNAKQYQTEPVKNSKSPRSRTPRKKTARQIMDERQEKQRKKLVQSKDYLRLKK